MKIRNIADAAFSKYGKRLEGYHLEDLLGQMKETPLPMDDVIYVPSSEALENTQAGEELAVRGYGGLPIQIGYCNGNNRKLNAVEYHRSSEIDIAVNDLILLLGRQQDIEDGDSYNTANIEAFLLPAGTAVELYATTLHYAPCSARDEGFRCVVVLPKGTNTELDFTLGKEGEDKLLTAKNKWLIAHPEAGIEDACCGLKGKNITVSIEE